MVSVLRKVIDFVRNPKNDLYVLLPVMCICFLLPLFRPEKGAFLHWCGLILSALVCIVIFLRVLFPIKEEE